MRGAHPYTGPVPSSGIPTPSSGSISVPGSGTGSALVAPTPAHVAVVGGHAVVAPTPAPGAVVGSHAVVAPIPAPGAVVGSHAVVAPIPAPGAVVGSGTGGAPVAPVGIPVLKVAQVLSPVCLLLEVMLVLPLLHLFQEMVWVLS